MGSYLPLITGSGGAVVALAIGMFLWMTGKIHSDGEYKAMEAERDYWRDAANAKDQAMEIERRIVNETAQAGQVNNQLLNAIVTLAGGRQALTGQPPRRKPPAKTGLTPEDLGL